MRVLLDTNAVDVVADDPGAFDLVKAQVEAGELEVLFTHDVVDELAAIGNLERRCRLLLILIAIGKLVPSAGFVVEYSRLDFAQLVDDGADLEALRSGRTRHSRDALIAATAIREECTLVSADRRLRHVARARGIATITGEELLAALAK